MIVDGDINIFAARPPNLLACAWVQQASVNPLNVMTGLFKASEILDFEMDDFAGVFAFVPMYRLGRIKVFEA